ncbi:hypothetical protein CIL05_03165 [Virgibacillus profundi]|uniref:YetF C-terminal domain-containing protein n=1 Tax=Virgibacillus profundi TaxID=2024555 RepID=A0A2A2IFG9_9BACI|nr:DUF421 domain-containing protein [Virgibacillus profundi]PAV30741.1 hypothetical protein CIL05_03165 [Virgibacillus profundi]PXY54925.1 DUF421 domain-containing protein [Virgibacillus profundi]
MDFFIGQETLTAVQWILRAIVAFFFLLFAAKIMGQRSISQLRLLDFTMAILIGNIIAHPLSDEQLGMKGSMITIIVLVILYVLSLFLGLKWNGVKRFLEPGPYPLVKNGEIIYKGLTKARISLDHLLTELRKEKVYDVEKVSLALWEPGGSLSVFLKSEHQTVTPSDLQMLTKPFSFPLPIIKEGNIDFNVLKQAGKDETWLRERIGIISAADITDILLATIDDNDNLKIYL